MWKYKHLKELFPITNFNVIHGGRYKKSPNDYVFFASHRTELLTEVYKSLYKNGEKTITEEFLKGFDAVSFAVFLMDDGSYDASVNKNYMLHTNSHNLDENILFSDYLQDKFGLTPKLQKVSKGKGWAIRFPVRDTETIENIIRPTVSEIKCMCYKLHSVRQGIIENYTSASYAAQRIQESFE